MSWKRVLQVYINAALNRGVWRDCKRDDDKREVFTQEADVIQWVPAITKAEILGKASVSYRVS